MRVNNNNFTLPRWRFTKWLTHAGHDVPLDIRQALVSSLFGSLPVYAGGVFNTLMVSAVLTVRHPIPSFFFWLVLEFAVCTIRLFVLLRAHRAAALGEDTHTDLYLILGLLWSFSVGYGCFVSILSGDWLASAITCLSAAAMVGGICFRNFGAPRFVAAMIALSLGPTAIASLLSGQPVLLLSLAQIPIYFVAMTIASQRLQEMFVSTMIAERANEHLARHDHLTGLLNRGGLLHELAVRLSKKTGRAGGWALFYLDLDGFKAVNDRYGHGVGDQLLQMVAARLKGFAPEDAIARIGGDEFIVLSSVGERAAAQLMAERLVLEVSSAAYAIGPCSARIGLSIGIALYPEHGRDVETLLHSADTALYQAKSSGGRRCAVAEAEAADWRVFPADQPSLQSVAGRR